ncbi:hypothetical protein PGTUg99_008140 [Puccinia graminis f. sp. tritici]|uniref:Uncharacterized protein n=1 Tax=Puccinia graminis f. sp. tritici TaxID=56615 RepID=A0A5B0PW79_PUCGR|nr:hypothetical protein PGTUg99_008140 [Puccinia graminis f. sp. tritici]
MGTKPQQASHQGQEQQHKSQEGPHGSPNNSALLPRINQDHNNPPNPMLGKWGGTCSVTPYQQ